MAIKSQQIVGIAGAFALVGGVLWASSALFSPPAEVPSVEISQVPERSWAVEITDLGAIEQPAVDKRTAAAH